MQPTLTAHPTYRHALRPAQQRNAFRHPLRRHTAAAAALALFGLGPLHAPAATYTWDGSGPNSNFSALDILNQ